MRVNVWRTFMISFEQVSKRYGALYAVKDVSFSVHRGQIVGLLGQNGAGKTTLMNIMTGCLAPSCGRVLIGGHDLLLEPREARRLIGYLPENAPLYDEMTVEAFLKFACELKEVVREEIPQHIRQIAQKTGLTDMLKRRIGNLSKGYRQRVGLAQALCGSPEIIILDEPAAGLDPRQNAEFRSLIRSLQNEHTVLLSSHILSEVQAVCDRILILKHGVVLFDSDLSDLKPDRTVLRASIAMGEGRLLPALRQLSSVTQVKVVRGGDEGITTVLLTAPRGAPVERELFTLVCGLQAPLLRLTPVEDSLEEIFLRATQD